MSNKTLFSGGPAYSVWDSGTFIMREDWEITDPEQFFEIPSATGFMQSKGIEDNVGKVSASPKILLSTLAAQLAALFPYTDNRQAGALVRPSSDLPMVIHARNGGTSNLGLAITLYAAMLMDMPELTFSPRKPLIDKVGWTFLQALGTNIGDAASIIGVASSTYSEPSWSIADELFDTYTLGLGFSGTMTGTTNSTTAISALSSTRQLLVGMGVSGAGIPTGATIASITSATAITLSVAATAGASGVTLTFTPVPIICEKDTLKFKPKCTLTAVTPSQEPTRDYKQGHVEGTLSFVPWNMDADTFYSTYCPETSKRLGMSIEQLGFPATITGTNAAGLALSIPCVSRTKSGQKYSTKTPRIGTVELYAIDTPDSALFTLAVN